MREKILKEIAFCVLLGVVIGTFWALLERMNMVAPPENQLEIETGIMWAVIVAGIFLLVDIGATLALLKKDDKRYAVEEKDERNQAIYSKAGFKTWNLNILLLVSSSAWLFFRGNAELALILGCLFAINAISMLALMVYYNKKM